MCWRAARRPQARQRSQHTLSSARARAVLARHERARAGGAEPNSWAPSPCGRQAMRGARTQAHPPRRARGRYLNALQTNAQHLLRYLAVAVVVNKRRRNVLKELIRAVEQQARGAAPRCPRRLPHPWAARRGHRLVPAGRRGAAVHVHASSACTCAQPGACLARAGPQWPGRRPAGLPRMAAAAARAACAAPAGASVIATLTLGPRRSRTSTPTR